MTQKNHSDNAVINDDKSIQIELTKREFFAAAALSGVITSCKLTSPEATALTAIWYADALIDALDKRTITHL